MKKRTTYDNHNEAINKLSILYQQLEDGIRDYLQSETYRLFLDTIARFHTYSINNTLLILSQKPDATYIAGYRDWKNKFHRAVKKGEKGIKILAPIKIIVYDKTKDEDVELMIFRPTTVFDYSQTIQIPKLPEIPLELKELQGEVENYDVTKAAILSTIPIPVTYENIQGSSKGYFVPSENRITIKASLSPLHECHTLIHEYAHSIMHRDCNESCNNATSRQDKETQAESVAYLACQMLGIGDTGEYTFPYISSWADKDLKAFNRDMALIKETAINIVTDIQHNLIS